MVVTFGSTCSGARLLEASLSRGMTIGADELPLTFVDDELYPILFFL